MQGVIEIPPEDQEYRGCKWNKDEKGMDVCIGKQSESRASK